VYLCRETMISSTLTNKARVQPRAWSTTLVFTRCCFTLQLYCGSQSSCCYPPPSAKSTLLQYYCTIIAQNTPPYRPPPFYAIYHTILVKRSTGHTHTHTHTHTPTENTTPDTHTRQEQHPKPPNEHPSQTLNNARRWRDDGACHLQYW